MEGFAKIMPSTMESYLASIDTLRFQPAYRHQLLIPVVSRQRRLTWCKLIFKADRKLISDQAGGWRDAVLVAIATMALLKPFVAGNL